MIPPISQKRLKPNRIKDAPYLQLAWPHKPIKNESKANEERRSGIDFVIATGE
jgi:hypothetical protein